LLESVPSGVTTWTAPALALEGTMVVISDGETTVNVAVNAIEVDASGAGQIRSQDFHGRPNLA
jgi:NaMN:DMB phosphoribosyltransferase